MTSACLGFSTCRIQFTPNDQDRAERNYSDRSLIELRQYDFADYSLRALDIENNKEEIFNIPLRKEDQYRRGKSSAQPDEINSSAGTYRLWLNANSRTKFLEALHMAVEEIKLISHDSPPPSATPPSSNAQTIQDQSKSNLRNEREQLKSSSRTDYDQSKSSMRNERDQRRSSSRSDDDPPKPNARNDRLTPRSNLRNEHEPPRHTSPYGDERIKPHEQAENGAFAGILADVYQLGKHIRQGHVDEATQLAKRLSKKRVQLQASLREQQQGDETPIHIRVRIDSNDRDISRTDDEITMNVYPPTTIRELRTAFEYSENFTSSNQYFFVNGHLAHESSTMQELNIRPNTLFVLFVIEQ